MIDQTVEALYKTHGYYLFRRCRALLGSDEEAHDALHEIFVKLIVKQPTLDHDRPVLPWLNRVATNHCFSQLRARRYRLHTALDAVHHLVDSSPESFIEHLASQRDLICRLLLPADNRTRLVVVAYFFDEHGVDRIATDLRVSVPTVRRVLRGFLERARKRAQRLSVTVDPQRTGGPR